MALCIYLICRTAEIELSHYTGLVYFCWLIHLCMKPAVNSGPIYPFAKHTHTHTCIHACTHTHTHTHTHIYIYGFPWWLSGKEPTWQWRRCGFDPWVGKVLWKRKWPPTLASLPGKSHGRRSLEGYSPWDHKRLPTISGQNTNYVSVYLSIDI